MMPSVRSAAVQYTLAALCAALAGLLCLAALFVAVGALLRGLLLAAVLLLSAAVVFLFRCRKNTPGNRIAVLLREAGHPDGEYAGLLSADAQTQDQLLVDIIREYADRIDRQELLRERAEYTALQSQINPHFLYNTLDTIRGKALEGEQELVLEMIESLSRMFRYSISNRSDLLSVEDEIKNVRDYVNIQRTRFADRFTVNYLMDRDDWKLMFFRVPKLILQPLVENAIVHGLEETIAGGEINIHIYRTQKLVVIKVEDNGKGLSGREVRAFNCAFRSGDSQGEQPSPGIALNNINKRIQLLYGADYGLAVSSVPGSGTAVEIVMPYEERDYAAGDLADPAPIQEA